MQSISDNINAVIESFHSGKDLALENHDSDSLIKELIEVKSNFPSVVFEGAASGIANKIFSEGQDLQLWLDFANKIDKAHQAQAFVGLGWTLAENAILPNSIFEKIQPIRYGRILDGYGYYHGLLRRRIFVKGAKQPEHISELELQAFDQGIGRGIWYTSKGDLNLLEQMLSAFDEKRIPALWRGIGVASFYVGGLDERLSKTLLELSEEYKASFLTGAALAAMGKSLNENISSADKITFEAIEMNTEKLAELALEAEKKFASSCSKDAYFEWLDELETNFN